jgi:hypothetical protein
MRSNVFRQRLLTFPRATIVPILIAAALGAPSPAQSAQMSPEQSARKLLVQYKQGGERHVRALRPELFANLDSRSKSIEKAISYEVFEEGNLNAYARIENGRRTVVLSAGLIQWIDYTATAVIIDQHFKRTDCGHDYMVYVAQGVAENSYRKRTGRGALQPVGDPFAFMRDVKSNCGRMSSTQFTSNKTAMALRDLLINSTMKLLISHEVAHHVLGHLEGRRASNDAESRRQEAEADAWALKRLVVTDSNPIEAMPLFLLFAYLEGFDLDESGGTHPTGINRLHELAISAKKIFDQDAEFQQYLRSQGKKEKWENDFALISKIYHEALAEANASKRGTSEKPRSVSGSNITQAPDGGLCQDLAVVIEASQSGFRSLRARSDGVGDWEGSVVFDGMSTCTAWSDADAYTCTTQRIADHQTNQKKYRHYRELARACLPDWEVTDRTKNRNGYPTSYSVFEQRGRRASVSVSESGGSAAGWYVSLRVTLSEEE